MLWEAILGCIIEDDAAAEVKMYPSYFVTCSCLLVRTFSGMHDKRVKGSVQW